MDRSCDAGAAAALLGVMMIMKVDPCVEGVTRMGVPTGAVAGIGISAFRRASACEFLRAFHRHKLKRLYTTP